MPHDNTEFLSLSRDTGNVTEVTFPVMGRDVLRLQHQGQKPHFTGKVTCSMRLKEMLWKLVGYFLQDARMSVLAGVVESGRHI